MSIILFFNEGYLDINEFVTASDIEIILSYIDHIFNSDCVSPGIFE